MFRIFPLFLFAFFAFKSEASSFVDNPLKKILKQNEVALGGYVSIADSKVIENLALPKKISFIWIEALQNDLAPREVQSLVITSENEGIVPIVRVPRNDRDEIKKYLGTGVLGIVIPGVRDRKDAENAVAATKFPPEGRRPPGVERANRYMGRLNDYMETANQNMLVILTVDNKDFVRNIDEIVSVKGIDVIHIGPLHLSSDMGAKIDSEEVKNAIERVVKAAQRKRIPLGGAISHLSQMEELKARGYRFLTVPGDMELLRSGIERFFTTPQP